MDSRKLHEVGDTGPTASISDEEIVTAFGATFAARRCVSAAKLVEAIRQTADRQLASEKPAKLQRRMDRLRKALEAIVALDFSQAPPRNRL